MSAARACEILAPDVPDDLARKTADRLIRSGCREPDTAAARLELGRGRVVREKLQRLVHDGHAEAVGEGESRQYRLRDQHMPDGEKPKREWVPIDRLVRDPELQMRVGGTDPAHVARLREEVRDPDFPGFELCEVVTDGTVTWLTDGYHRVDALEAEGKGQVECAVYKGTYTDARLRALKANSKHALNRKPEDCRRSFDTLVNDAALLKRVLAGVKEDGGVQRALAKATGLGVGTVGKYLDLAGLKATRTGKLEKVPAQTTPKTSSAKTESPPQPPAPPPIAASADVSEPVYTVPPPPSPHPLFPPPKPVDRATKAGEYRTYQLVADQILRDLRSAAAGLNNLLSGPGGAYLERVKVGGTPLCRKVGDKSTPVGQVRPDVWQDPRLDLLIEAVRRTRVRVPCAGCGGKAGGCRACTFTGFLPEFSGDDAPAGPALEFPDPWEWQDRPTEGTS